MKRLVIPAMIGLLSGCSTPPVSHVPPPQEGAGITGLTQSVVNAATGPEVAAALSRRYRDTRNNCGKDSMPAFLCTGVLARGTDRAIGFDAWDPSPAAVRVGGTSFSYIRSDYKMQRLAFTYNKGYIFYPILSTPPDKDKIEVLCFFPIDGASDLRDSNGCGGIAGNPGTVACAKQNILTGAQWAANYRKYAPTGHNYKGVCSFDVRDALNNQSGPNFYQGMVGGRAISPSTFQIPNDVKLKTWAKGRAKTLPIEAFFYYVRDGKSGLADVQIDQRRFKQLTGVTLPIIKTTFPRTLD